MLKNIFFVLICIFYKKYILVDLIVEEELIMDILVIVVLDFLDQIVFFNKLGGNVFVGLLVIKVRVFLVFLQF